MKLTVDAVVFSYINEELNVLLIERAFDPFKGKFALAGGFVNEDETTEDAVLRKVKEETGISLDYLEQLYTFSDTDRDPRERIVTVSYYGIIAPIKTEFVKNVHAKRVVWMPISKLSQHNIMKLETRDENGDMVIENLYEAASKGSAGVLKKIPVDKLRLAFDHNKILDYAVERLRNKVRYEPVGFDLLPKYFSMTELWSLYCAILGKEIDRRNFTRKIKKLGLLKEAPFKTNGDVGRKAQLYEFDEETYLLLKRDGFNFDI